MWNLARASVVLTACLAMANSAAAVDLFSPYVSVSLPDTPVHLGEVWGPGTRQVGAKLNARVVANCPYHIEASFQGLRHQGGKATISPKHMSVAINGKEVGVGNRRTAIANASKPTSARGVDVPVDLQVRVTGLASYPAGRYQGTLVITVMVGP